MPVRLCRLPRQTLDIGLVVHGRVELRTFPNGAAVVMHDAQIDIGVVRIAHGDRLSEEAEVPLHPSASCPKDTR